MKSEKCGLGLRVELFGTTLGNLLEIMVGPVDVHRKGVAAPLTSTIELQSRIPA